MGIEIGDQALPPDGKTGDPFDEGLRLYSRMIASHILKDLGKIKPPDNSDAPISLSFDNEPMVGGDKQ